MPETAGDQLISTGVVNSLKKQHPDSNIYVACQAQYKSIWKNNPDIAAVIDYEPGMDNYRKYQTCGMSRGLFDIVHLPYAITQRMPAGWLLGNHGPWLGQAYANMCNVPFGEMFLDTDDSILEDLPEIYMTLQGNTSKDIKDYDYLDEVVERIHDIPIVQIGAKSDQLVECENILDFRSKCTWQQSASIIKNSKFHLSLDSAPMHIAGMFGTPQLVIFGGTYSTAAINPNYANTYVIATEDFGVCHSPCHYVECEAKKQGFAKCINNIGVDEIVEKVSEILGSQYVDVNKEPTVSAYIIIRDGIKYGFPYQKCILSALKVCDEVVVVDGGSTDGTWEDLQKMVKLETSFQGKVYNLDLTKAGILRVEQHEWNLNNPTLMGDEKQYARSLCTGDWVLQLDADEIIKCEPGDLHKLAKRYSKENLLAFPQINYYGDSKHIRIEDQCWKWRFSPNKPNIIHGVHKQARKIDPQTGQICMSKDSSDSCEFIFADSLEVIKPKLAFYLHLERAHQAWRQGNEEITPTLYRKILREVIDSGVPYVLHYSWMDLERKTANGEFWDSGYHKEAHNTSMDIKKRVQEGEGRNVIEFEV